jgi:hypothetical protein
MRKKSPKAHYENGLISDMRDSAASASSAMKKKALAESKKAKVKTKSVFSSLTRTEAKKLLSL